MLRRYRDDHRILHVSGDNFQDGRWRGSGSYYFSTYAHSWGWATWSRAWRDYDVSMSAWPTAHREGWLRSVFDDPEEVGYWESELEGVYRGRIDTWDYQWLFACWRRGGLSILPNRNLVTNIGEGPDATHFKEGHSTLGVPTRELTELIHPTDVLRDKEADRYTFERHIYVGPPHDTGSWLLRLKRRLALGPGAKRLLRRALR